MSDDIQFLAYLKTADRSDSKALINTLDFYHDNTRSDFKSELSDLDELPTFSNVKLVSDAEVLFWFDDDAFLASETIADIASLTGCKVCLSAEIGDVLLVVEHASDGKQKLLYSDDDEYEFERATKLMEFLENYNGNVEELIIYLGRNLG